MPLMTATYSHEDRKLRLYSIDRLDEETHARVKAAGFEWVPHQEHFVAPMWTSRRQDLLLELCGDISDEDTGFVERANGFGVLHATEAVEANRVRGFYPTPATRWTNANGCSLRAA